MSNGLNIAAQLFSNCLNQPVKNVHLGYGSFITLDFGEKEKTIEVNTRKGIRTSIRGEWHLWIYMAAWRLDQKNKSIIGAADDRGKIEKGLRILEKKKLLNFKILNPAFDLLFQFQDDLQLSLFSFGVENYEQWKFFTPDDMVFIAGPGSTYTYKKDK